MKLKIVIHPADEGGYWAEVPALPGCASEGDSMDEVLANTREAIEAWLSVDIAPSSDTSAQIVELAL